MLFYMLGAKLKHKFVNSKFIFLLQIDLILALKLYNFYPKLIKYILQIKIVMKTSDN